MSSSMWRMKDRIHLFPRRIDHYRRLLREGAELELAREYLRQICADQAERPELDKGTDIERHHDL